MALRHDFLVSLTLMLGGLAVAGNCAKLEAQEHMATQVTSIEGLPSTA